MAEPMKIINNPSITTDVFEYDEVGRVSAIAGHPLAGEGGGTIEKSDLMWKPSVENDGYVHWTLASSATTPAPAYISGAQGPAGPQGVSGNPGKNPEFRINPSNAEWQWKYSGDEGWTDLGVVASGAVGPQGLSGNSGKDGISPTAITATISGGNRVTFTYGEGSSTYIDVMSGASGANGKDGISPTVSTETIAGGNRVTFTYGEGSTKSIDVMSGVSGANGSDGFSPTVVTADIPVSDQFPAGGTKVTITDSVGQHIFDISNGQNGQGATVNLLGGEGIEVNKAGANYTISVSADYATKSYVDSASAYALSQAETWVGNQHYLVANDIAGKADKTDLQYVSAGVDYVSAHIPSLNGYATEQYVQGASAEVTAWVNGQGYLKSVPDYYITETELADYNYVTTATTNSLSSEIEEISSTLNDKYTLSAGTGIYFYEDSINKTTRIDCTVTAATTVAQLTDSANYYTINQTSAASELTTEFAKYALLANIPTKVTDLTDSANYVVTGDILTGTGNKLTGIKIGSTNYTVPTTDLSNYYTKSQTSAASALSAEFAKYLTSVITDTTLTGDGTDNSHKLGVAWSTLSGNTIVSAKSANSTEYITNGIGYSGFNDISAKFDSLTSYVPYSATVLPIGTNNTATNNSIAIGSNNMANDLGFAVGQSNTALKRSLAFGVNNYANDISLAIGYQNTASGRNDNNQSAVNIAIGYGNSAADHAAALINVCTAENYAFAAGHGNSAIDNSVAFGRNTSAYFYSFDFGHSNDVRYYSYAFGRGLHYEGQWANGSQYGAFVIGGWNATTSYATTADAPLFIVGNGSNGHPSDGFIVYRDGNVSAKQYKAEGYTQNNTYVEASVPKSLPNTGDNTMVVQKMFVCTSDPDIVAHVALANGEGCIFFRVGS